MKDHGGIFYEPKREIRNIMVIKNTIINLLNGGLQEIKQEKESKGTVAVQRTNTLPIGRTLPFSRRLLAPDRAPISDPLNFLSLFPTIPH